MSRNRITIPWLEICSLCGRHLCCLFDGPYMHAVEYLLKIQDVAIKEHDRFWCERIHWYPVKKNKPVVRFKMVKIPVWTLMFHSTGILEAGIIPSINRHETTTHARISWICYQTVHWPSSTRTWRWSSRLVFVGYTSIFTCSRHSSGTLHDWASVKRGLSVHIRGWKAAPRVLDAPALNY